MDLFSQSTSVWSVAFWQFSLNTQSLSLHTRLREIENKNMLWGWIYVHKAQVKGGLLDGFIGSSKRISVLSDVYKMDV